MIGRLAGTLIERDGMEVIVDCGGVGYEVTCSAYTLASLPAVGERVVLRVFTQATENKVALFGFGDAGERTLFDLLITVKNVGPSSAMAILSGGHSPSGIADLIARGDLAGLTRIKGVGKKTAEMLIVELREKCEQLGLALTAGGAMRMVVSPAVVRPHRHPLLQEVADALGNLGWRPVEVDKAVAELQVGESSRLEELLKQALRSMSR
ncbi:MAG: Holliday junction branch migration protein RuvA [Myxococcales bacterium]|nr:Holliday junction branch migration protein RuvA [Myxococcales bacterium]